MSGIATLTRPAAPSAVPAAPARAPVRVGSLRVALVLMVWAASLTAVGSSRALVTSFGGTVRTLGSANPYVDDTAELLGWLFALTALCVALGAARSLGAGRLVRPAIAVAVCGATMLAAESACSLWAVAIANTAAHPKGWLSSATSQVAATRDVLALSKAAAVFGSVGLLCLVGACAIALRASSLLGSLARARAFLTLGLGFVWMAVGEIASLTYLWSQTAPGRAGVLVVYASSVLGWVLVALAIGLFGVALRGPRTRALRIAVPIGVVGALCLAAWSGTVLAYAELLVSSSEADSFVTLSKIGAALQWCGWLGIALAVGVMAARVTAVNLSMRRGVAPAAG